MKCSHNVLRWNCDACSREAAEKALGEIMVLCGYPDPAEGEGTSPEEVVVLVDKAISNYNQTVGLFACCIKSGEAWSVQCEQALQKLKGER